MSRITRMLLVPSLLPLTSSLGACASTGATFGSGVGDSFPEHPPYRAGAEIAVVASDTTHLGHLPVTFQRGASQSSVFDPGSATKSPIAKLLDQMNAFLDSLDVSEALVTESRAPSSAVPPDVRFGCIPSLGIPGNDCEERGDSALGRGHQTMQLAVGRPSPEWISWTRELAMRHGTRRILVITLEVGQYLMRQEGLSGTKVLELGTGNRATLPWLTSLETPVSVLQLTGALVDENGKAIRIGAEGFFPRRTPLLASAVGAQALISDADAESASTLTREDLAGRPLAWKVAMLELVAGLTGRRPLPLRERGNSARLFSQGPNHD
jgi:hypothetical protein